MDFRLYCQGRETSSRIYVKLNVWHKWMRTSAYRILLLSQHADGAPGNDRSRFRYQSNSGMGGCDLIPPIQTRFSVRRMSTGGGTFVFLPLEDFCVFSLSAAGKARMGMPATVWGTAIRNCFGFYFLFHGSPEFRKAYPHRTCLMPLLGKPERLSRKKNMFRSRHFVNHEENLRQWTRGNPFRPFSRR